MKGGSSIKEENNIRRQNIGYFSGFFLEGKNIMDNVQTLSIFYSYFEVLDL